MMHALVMLLCCGDWMPPQWVWDVPCVYSLVHAAGHSEELLPERCTDWHSGRYWSSGDGYGYVLIVLRRNFRENGHLPRLWVAGNFLAGEDWIEERIAFAELYLDYCLDQADLYPTRAAYCKDVADNVRRMIEAHRCLIDARRGQRYEYGDTCYNLDPIWLRSRLEDLRAMIGDANFYAGRLPDVVPTHLFRRIP